MSPAPSSFSASPKLLGTFFCLYLAQSIPMSFFSSALQVMMRQADYSLAVIALFRMVKLPWVLKLIWAPWVDERCTTLRGYKRLIFSSQFVYAFFILVAALLNTQTHLPWVLLLVFLALLSSATQDIATDALATLSFRRQDKSLVNSMQTMGSFGGTLVGSGLLLMLLHRYGWQTVVPCLCLFVLVAAVPLALNRRLHTAPKEKTIRAHPLDLVRFFARRAIWRQIGFLVIYYAAIIGTLSVIRPYLVDLGYSMSQIGLMSIAGTGTAFLISFPVGLLIRRIGRERARLLFACFTLFVLLYFRWMASFTPSIAWLSIGVVLLWSSYGMSSVVVYTTAMDCVRPGYEGTDFTIQTAITHASGLLVAFAAGVVGDGYGYRTLFTFEAVLAALSVLYIVVCFRPKRSIHPVA
ncbi:MAG: MFS transporter [Prevotellaceae bacterium]|jgi:MFS family permease|nr:MFS transporter [Prevotellaceae bacterium]